MKNPEKNTTATMNTTPAVMPTHAAACDNRLARRRSGMSGLAGGGGGGGGVVIDVGVVAGSAVSLIPPIMPMRA
jgi:hypothetical protein